MILMQGSLMLKGSTANASQKAVGGAPLAQKGPSSKKLHSQSKFGRQLPMLATASTANPAKPEKRNCSFFLGAYPKKH